MLLRFIVQIPRILTNLLVVGCVCLCPEVASPNSFEVKISSQPTVLKAGDSLDRELLGGEDHSYVLELARNEFVHIVVDQQGVDVATVIQGPDGLKSPQIDRPNGTRGKDSFSWIAQTEGRYVFSVRWLDGPKTSGRYSLKVEAIRPARQSDALRIEAERAVSAGSELLLKGDPESLRLCIKKFRDAAKLWKILDDKYEEAIALYGTGFTLRLIGENQEAITDLTRALELLGNDDYGRAITSVALGWPLMYLGDLDGAMKSFDLAFKLALPASSLRVEGIALFGLGWTHALRGDYAAALQRFQESLKLRQQMNDARGEALTLAGIGKVEAFMGNNNRARDYLELALSRLPKSRDTLARGDILSNLGWVSRSLNEDSVALDYFTRALPLRLGDRIGEATTLYGISTISQRLGRFEQSITAIEDALQIIESLRIRGLNQQLRLSYFASIQDYYDFYIYLLMRLDKLRPGQGYSSKALHACERARARVLIDLLAESQIDLRHGVDHSLLAEERRIDEALSAEVARQYQQPNTASHLTSQLPTLARQREVVRAQIREASPRYAAILQPQPLTALQIQKEVLDEQTVLLEYALGEDESYMWLVTPHDVMSYRLPRRSEIEQRANLLNELLRERNRTVPGEVPIEKRNRIAKADTHEMQLRKDLGQVLLGPLEGRVIGKRLLIVAPDALQYLPFGALIEPGTRNSPLIKDHEIVVLPSATTMSVLRTTTRNRPPQPNSVIVFGDPVFDSDDERVARPVQDRKQTKSVALTSLGSTMTPRDAENTQNFPRLLSSRWEASQIVAIAGGEHRKLLLDFDANRSMATGSEISRFRFLHFATHAIVDNKNPELSGIVLTMVDKNGRSQNGFLSSHEIFDLKLPAELVVLSACRTGLGKEFKGEGLIGLTRAFMYAGAARIVVSIWDVDDKPTAELMVRFYRQMFGPNKRQPAAALRAAQLEMLRDPRWHSPYFWGAFMLQGEW